MTVKTPWGELRLDAGDWAEAFDAAEPGTPHNEAREDIRAALLGILADQNDGAAPADQLRVSQLRPILDVWLAEHADGVACVIGDATFPGTSRVRSLSPTLAKGLEFDLVILVNPQAFGTGVEGAVDRYVAMTRATQHLFILTKFMREAEPPPAGLLGAVDQRDTDVGDPDVPTIDHVRAQIEGEGQHADPLGGRLELQQRPVRDADHLSRGQGAPLGLGDGRDAGWRRRPGQPTLPLLHPGERGPRHLKALGQLALREACPLTSFNHPRGDLGPFSEPFPAHDDLHRWATLRGHVVTRKNARGSHDHDSAKLAATFWTVTATIGLAGLNVLTWLMACLDACGHSGGKPLTGPDPAWRSVTPAVGMPSHRTSEYLLRTDVATRILVSPLTLVPWPITSSPESTTIRTPHCRLTTPATSNGPAAGPGSTTGPGRW